MSVKYLILSSFLSNFSFFLETKVPFNGHDFLGTTCCTEFLERTFNGRKYNEQKLISKVKCHKSIIQVKENTLF